MHHSIFLLTYSESAPVNTFTEHHGSGWSVKDLQHTYVFPFTWNLEVADVYQNLGDSVYVVSEFYVTSLV